MSPRHQNLMRLLSTGNPTTAKELRRELGWSLDAVHRALNRLGKDGHTEMLMVEGVEHFAACKQSSKEAV